MASALIADDSRSRPGGELRSFTSETVARGGLAPWQARRVRDQVEARLGAAVRVEEFAAVAGLSPRYFSRAFKVSFGLTPHAYVTCRRIERAKVLMLQTDEGLSQIALACGLADQAHLSRLFRQVVGVSPSAWRRGKRAAMRGGGSGAGRMLVTARPS